MAANLLQIPSELRNQIYELVLQCEEPLDPWNDCYRPHKLNAALLFVNKAVHREASSLLYSQNCFDFSTRASEDIERFLKQIGCANARSIRSIRIDIPDFSSLELGNVILANDSAEVIASMRTHCTNLTTLTTAVTSTNDFADMLDDVDDHDVVKEALSLIDSQFRAIPTLKGVTVEVHEDAPDDHISGEMEKLGWTIKTVEYEDYFLYDREFNEFVDYDPDHPDYFEDGNDIGYDSEY